MECQDEEVNRNSIIESFFYTVFIFEEDVIPHVLHYIEFWLKYDGICFCEE